MNTLLLRPTDVLFFRDGRPMSDALAGHTAAWPLPDVTNHALHAALHRAALEGVHLHRRGRSGAYSEEEKHRDRRFGSLVTAGPFPVDRRGNWFFPRPRDAQQSRSIKVTLRPTTSVAGIDHPWRSSSLPAPLSYAVGNTEPPSKDAGGEPWISREAFESYVRGDEFHGGALAQHFLRDDEIGDLEAQIGIAIDPETQTTGQREETGEIYSAHYLRVREGFRLGVLAEALDKANGETSQPRDLLLTLFNGHPTQIVVGGQQRICTAEATPCRTLPLPRGLTNGFNRTGEQASQRWLMKWILLSPAIWPEIPAGTSKRGTERLHHPGGWLPNWICPDTGAVLLREVDETERRRRRSLNFAGKGYATDENAGDIAARLVAAIVPKPLVVTGWALPDEAAGEEGGAKSTHLAVPAGAVYYLEADSAAAAVALADALNWHGAVTGDPAKDFATIQHRRSTLLGEKGYGLGVCGTWSFYPETAGAKP